MTVKELHDALTILLNKDIDANLYIADGNTYTTDFVLEIGERNIYIEPTRKILDTE